jgi:hypothetical protein
MEDNERIIARFLFYPGFIGNWLTWGCFLEAEKPIPQKKNFFKPYAHLPKGHAIATTAPAVRLQIKF